MLEQFVFRPQAWMAQGLCAGATDLMFDDARVDEAKQVCAACPVRVRCLGFAVELGPACVGVWGGTTGRERSRLRRETSEAA